jgi:dTMP kinase
MTQATKKGAFIVLDGNDGSGKATQAELLAQALAREGVSCLKVDFPGYDRTISGKLLAECLAGAHGDFVNLDPRIASMLYAADRFESAELIRNALSEGTIVIADRFTSSNQIHQGGKVADESERIAFLEWLDHLEHGAFGIPRPDAIVYLKVPLEVSLKLLAGKRAAKNSNLQDGEMDQVESDRAYLERSHATAGWLVARQPNWHLVECTGENGEEMRSREAIHEDVMACLRSALVF